MPCLCHADYAMASTDYTMAFIRSLMHPRTQSTAHQNFMPKLAGFHSVSGIWSFLSAFFSLCLFVHHLGARVLRYLQALRAPDQALRRPAGEQRLEKPFPRRVITVFNLGLFYMGILYSRRSL